MPRPLVVATLTGADGVLPRAVVWHGRRCRVVGIEEEWRVVDEWWREEICRHYFTVALDDGRRLTLFHDVLADTWWTHTK